VKKCRSFVDLSIETVVKNLLRPRFPKKDYYYDRFIADAFGTHSIRQFQPPADVPEEDSLSYHSRMILLCGWLHKNFAEYSDDDKRLRIKDDFGERIYPKILSAISGIPEKHAEDMLTPIRGELQEYFDCAYSRRFSALVRDYKKEAVTLCEKYSEQ